MKHKKLLAIKSSAKIQMCADSISQPIFHETKSAKCVFVSTKLRTWTSAIFTSFMYFESFWLSVGDAMTLC